VATDIPGAAGDEDGDFGHAIGASEGERSMPAEGTVIPPYVRFRPKADIKRVLASGA
jgi:hypothetical protein